MKDWIRTTKIPERYGVKKSYANELVRQMRLSPDARPEDFIFDGRVRLVAVDALEDFWRKRGME